MIVAVVFIEPHERFEAIEAYRTRLTSGQIDEINDAPESAIIRLSFGGFETELTFIEEG